MIDLYRQRSVNRDFTAHGRMESLAEFGLKRLKHYGLKALAQLPQKVNKVYCIFILHILQEKHNWQLTVWLQLSCHKWVAFDFFASIFTKPINQIAGMQPTSLLVPLLWSFDAASRIKNYPENIVVWTMTICIFLKVWKFFCSLS